jgi:hypothetical protein
LNIFLSYASEDRDIAEEIQLALSGAGHRVFYDKASLPAAGDYHGRIEHAVREADAFVFLISPASVSKGNYSMSELKFARDKWPHPKGHVIPVRLHETPFPAIPPYLKSVTLLEPEGNIAAEVAAAVAVIARERKPGGKEGTGPIHVTEGGASSRKKWIWIGVIAFVLVALIVDNWDQIVAEDISPPPPPSISSGTPGVGIQGPDTPGRQAPASAPPPVASADQSEAGKAASEIVRSIRNGELDKLWNTQTSAYFKSRFSQETFVANLMLGRQQLGPPLHSQFIDMAYSQQDPGTGVRGEIYAFNYVTAYRPGRFHERIVVVKEQDGRFRLAGIWSAPAP